ncbi:hypothetical protein TrRE_jg7720, partial [Triparma retinervis]
MVTQFNATSQMKEAGLRVTLEKVDMDGDCMFNAVLRGLWSVEDAGGERAEVQVGEEREEEGWREAGGDNANKIEKKYKHKRGGSKTCKEEEEEEEEDNAQEDNKGEDSYSSSSSSSSSSSDVNPTCLSTSLDTLAFRTIVARHLWSSRSLYLPFFTPISDSDNLLLSNKKAGRCDNEDLQDRDFSSYVSRMVSPGSWGGELELLAMSRVFGREVWVLHLGGGGGGG